MTINKQVFTGTTNMSTATGIRPTGEVAHSQRTEEAFCYVCNNSFDYVYPPEGPNSEKRSLRLQISQASLDPSNPHLRNLLLPLEVLLVDETSKMLYEDKFEFDTWGQFLYHSWRKYDKGIRSYLDMQDKPCDDRYHNDANPTKAFEYGEAMREMTRDQAFPSQIEGNPAIVGLKTHTLWQLHHPTAA